MLSQLQKKSSWNWFIWNRKFNICDFVSGQKIQNIYERCWYKKLLKNSRQREQTYSSVQLVEPDPFHKKNRKKNRAKISSNPNSQNGTGLYKLSEKISDKVPTLETFYSIYTQEFTTSLEPSFQFGFGTDRSLHLDMPDTYYSLKLQLLKARLIDAFKKNSA